MNMRSKLVAITGSALILASTITMGAAQTGEDTLGNASVEVTRDDGANTISVWIMNSDFSSHAYSLAETPVDGTITLGVDDFRGTAVGWDVYVKAGNFEGDNGREFGPDQLVLTGGTPALNAEITQGGVNTTGQSVVSPLELSGSFQEIWSADPGFGAGYFVLAADAELTIPAGTLEGTYTSEMTVSLEAGPTAPVD